MRLLRWAHAAFAIGAFGGLALDAPALANDTTAELTSGGLVLEQSADIEMRSEDLAISEREISVRYRFFNHGAADETVDGRLSDARCRLAGRRHEYRSSRSGIAEFSGFSHLRRRSRGRGAIRAEGFRRRGGNFRAGSSPWACRSRRRATRHGRRWIALGRADQDKLIKQKIAAPDDYDVGKGWEHHVVPNWTLKSSFYWRQTFPAGREIMVEHRYTPSVGATTGTRLQMDPIDPRRPQRIRNPLLRRQAFPGRRCRPRWASG